MSRETRNELSRTIDGVVLRGMCRACKREVCGELALHLIWMQGEIGVEVLISEGDRAHSIAAVKLDGMPLVRIIDADTSTAT